ncbi:MAG: hypothetical protein E7168_05080 [Firmicutes bacterium]|nr:hypothetical protein [Bacillota bacterium]
MKKKKNNYLIGSQFILIIFTSLTLAIIALGGSYVLFKNQTDDKDYNTFKEENLEISYVDNGNGNGDVLSLINQEPQPDSEWENIIPYRFDVKNKGEQEEIYQIKLLTDFSIVLEDECSSKVLSNQAIKVKVDNKEPIILGDLETKDYIIYESNQPLLPGSSEIHEIRIWIDDNSSIDILEKHFHGKLLIEKKEKQIYKEYQIGDKVTLADGSSYHVLENSGIKESKVKLLSDYNLLESGIQDTNCIINSFINEKISNSQIKDTSEKYYCSTQDYQSINTILNNYYTTLKKNEIIENKNQIRLPLKNEIENITKKENNVNKLWLLTSNYWLFESSQKEKKNWTVYLDSENEVLSLAEKDSNFFGIRPVIIVDKKLIKY